MLKEAFENGIIPGEIYGHLLPDKVTINNSARDSLAKIGNPAVKDVAFEGFLTIIRVPSSALETSREYLKSVDRWQRTS